MTQKKRKHWGILAGIIVGGAIGSVISLLFAPEKGEKTRKKVIKKGREIFEAGKNKAEDLWEEYRKK